MPKKTKREKLIAEARRIIKQSQQPVQTVISSPTELHVNKETINQKPSAFSWNSQTTSHSIKGLNDEIEYAQIRKNLTKTVILAAIAVLIEFAFYWKLG
jgi:hypothetical protein